MPDGISIGDLERLVNDISFEKIELTLRQPNIFNALAIERRELSHSNFLSWLLDSDGSHGLGSLVLGKFLRDIFSDNRATTRTFFDADLLDKRTVEVRREWRNIDILLILPDDVIAIENKVDTKDHSGQLSRYRQTIAEAFPDKHKHFVFLTPFGVAPSEEGEDEFYVCYSYQNIVDILNRILEVHGANLPPKVMHYLDDYLTLIRRELLMTDPLNEMATKIYLAHREAIDFLFENRPDPSSELYGYFEEALHKEGFKIGSKNKGYIRFVTPELMDCMPRSTEGWPDREVFLFEIEYFWSDKKAYVKAVIAPGETELQQRILAAARTLQDRYPKEWKEPSGKKWRTFFSKNFPLVASDLIKEGPDEIRKKVREIVEKVAPTARLICEAIEAEIRTPRT